LKLCCQSTNNGPCSRIAGIRTVKVANGTAAGAENNSMDENKGTVLCCDCGFIFMKDLLGESTIESND